jgi:hypothetical protein
MNSHPDPLVGQWVRSWEEDAGDVHAYRREGFDFPLSRRPRSVLELQADGRVVSRSGGPADTLVDREGRWEVGDPALLTLHWDSPGEQTAAQIVELEDDLLRLRPLSGTIDSPEARSGGLQ